MKRYYIEVGGMCWALDPAVVEKYLCTFPDGVSRVLKTPFTGLEITLEGVDEDGL